MTTRAHHLRLVAFLALLALHLPATTQYLPQPKPVPVEPAVPVETPAQAVARKAKEQQTAKAERDKENALAEAENARKALAQANAAAARERKAKEALEAENKRLADANAKAEAQLKQRQAEMSAAQAAAQAATPVVPAATAGASSAAAAAVKADTGLTDWDRRLGKVALPTGNYLRGSADEEGRLDDEGPVTTVEIKHRLAFGRTEVTRGQFAAFVQATAYKTDAEKAGGCYTWLDNKWQQSAQTNWKNPGFAQTDEHPVVCVSWNDANAYLAWLNGQAGFSPTDTKRYRLPSETEWEYAARGVISVNQNRSGSQHWRYSWGDDKGLTEMCTYANGADLTSKKQMNWAPTSNCEDGYVYTAPAGRFRENKFGLKDMLGNAWEWTQDCYEQRYPKGLTDGRAHESTTNCNRVLRGGSWDDYPHGLRAAFRFRYAPGNSSSGAGFRLARTLP